MPITNNEAYIYNCIATSISVIGFMVRFYTIGTTPQGTSGRNTKQQVATVLNSTGMYSLLRHPLYLGNYLIWFGFLLFFYNLWLFFIVTLLYVLYYERIMFAEENYLLKKDMILSVLICHLYIIWAQDFYVN